MKYLNLSKISFFKSGKTALMCTLVLLSVKSQAQCPQGDVVLVSQADINAFAATYPNCTQIDGFLQIGAGNTDPQSDITDLTPLGNITHINGNLFIQNNGALQHLNGLNIAGIDGRVFIGGDNNTNTNALLENIDGLSGLTTVGGEVAIAHNPLLTHLNGLRHLTSIGGGLFVEYNEQLRNIDSLHRLAHLAGPLEVSTNPVLTQLNGLKSLTSVGNIFIAYNDALENINGLSNLNTINGFIRIRNNAVLQNLNSFSKITRITGNIYIANNTILNNISGLQKIDPNSIEIALEILNNPALSVCNLPNFCTYLSNSPTTHPREITGNAGNCVSEQTIKEACAAVSIAEAGIDKLSFYPNPVTDLLYLTSGTEITRVSIMNITGQTVIDQDVFSNKVQIDMRGLHTGNYLVKVVAKGAEQTMIVVKQ